MTENVDLEFSGEIWEWRGPAPYCFVTVPEGESLDLQAISPGVSYGWGMVPVSARIGHTEWKTSLWPKEGGYVLPLKDKVRRAEGIHEGDTVAVRLSAVEQPPKDQAKESPRRPAGKSPNRSRPSAPRGSREPVTEDQLTVVPANEAAWEDLRAIFDSTGDASRCWCQRYKMERGESWRSEGPAELASRLRSQTACGQPDSTTTSGLVAYLDGEPVGWCAVDPRPDNPRLLRNCRVPWTGRAEDKTDAGVWAVTCFVTRAGFRGRGISRALARAAVDFARKRGARALEGYPDLVEEGSYVGTVGTFAAAGLVEVNKPTIRRVVMRIEF